MGTPCYIGKQIGKPQETLPENLYLTIYCHWDGYPSHVGKMLHEHYSELSKVDQMLAFGDASSINESLEASVFFGRDKNETANVSAEAMSLGDMVGEVPYIYLFDGVRWQATKDGDRFLDIPEAIALQKAELF